MKRAPKKDSFIGLKLSFVEADKWHKAARDLGITTSELVRRAATEYIEKKTEKNIAL